MELGGQRVRRLQAITPPHLPEVSRHEEKRRVAKDAVKSERDPARACDHECRRGGIKRHTCRQEPSHHRGGSAVPYLRDDGGGVAPKRQHYDAHAG